MRTQERGERGEGGRREGSSWRNEEIRERREGEVGESEQKVRRLTKHSHYRPIFLLTNIRYDAFLFNAFHTLTPLSCDEKKGNGLY